MTVKFLACAFTANRSNGMRVYTECNVTDGVGVARRRGRLKCEGKHIDGWPASRKEQGRLDDKNDGSVMGEMRRKKG